MASIGWFLEILLIVLLVITLLHAVRLERALQTLRQDRAALGDAIAGFDTSTRHAEAGIGKLQAATFESAQLLGQRLEKGITLKDDLQFLIDRGESLADRLEASVRSVRGPAAPVIAPAAAAHAAEPPPKMRSQAERDLLLALRAGQ